MSRVTPNANGDKGQKVVETQKQQILERIQYMEEDVEGENVEK